MQEEQGMQTLKFEIYAYRLAKHRYGWNDRNSDFPFPTLQLFDEEGNPNNTMVVVYAVLIDETVKIEDAYSAEGFGFTGTRKFDNETGM